VPLADKMTITAIATTVGMSRQNVYKWIHRCLEERCPGLHEKPRPSRRAATAFRFGGMLKNCQHPNREDGYRPKAGQRASGPGAPAAYGPCVSVCSTPCSAIHTLVSSGYVSDGVRH